MYARITGTTLFVAAVVLSSSPLMAQPGRGTGPLGRGPGGDPTFAADRDLFHELISHRADIRREVKQTDHGVETLTASDVPQGAAAIQNH